MGGGWLTLVVLGRSSGRRGAGVGEAAQLKLGDGGAEVGGGDAKVGDGGAEVGGGGADVGGGGAEVGGGGDGKP